ncbi:MAG: nicotinate-nucleotide adenylyltransferase [Thioalkalivibrio sp.]|nr:MAG: nicotinate-nucleotide adenylyltransferase [Thioalkalivibrio sp.]
MIGILGGTFDPVHFGHLRPALEVRESLGLSEVRFIPSHVPPHRDPPEVASHHRLAMVERAIAGVPGFVADARELSRPGPSFTVDTLGELRREIGAECPLLLVMGMDAFIGLDSWHRWREIPRLAHVVATHRPGTEPATDSPCMALAEVADSVVALQSAPSGRVCFQPVTQLDISGTAIREGLRSGRSPRFLLPGSVLHYIAEHRLYHDNAGPPE